MRQELFDSKGYNLKLQSGMVGQTESVLTGNVTVYIGSPLSQALDPGGADRDVTLPAETAGLFFFLTNVGSSDNLVIKNDAGGTVCTLTPGDSAWVVSTATQWVALRAWADLGVMGPSGAGHASGLTPDTPASSGTTKFLREDGTWDVPSGAGGTAAFEYITDGTNTATAGSQDTFKLRSNSGKITITVTNNDATHGDNADFDVDESAVDHDSLLNFEADEHVDHTAVSITAGNGLSGGGTIASTRSLALDIDGLSSTTPVLGDSIALFDADLVTEMKVTLTAVNEIFALTNLADYDANDHIDHTSVSITAGEGLSGGGTIASSRSLALDVSNLTEITSGVDISNDFYVLYDADAGEHKKLKPTNAPSGSAASTSAQGIVELATQAEAEAQTDTARAVTPDAIQDFAVRTKTQTFTKGQRGAIATLTDGATITPDMDDGNNFTVTLGGNRTLANPSNLAAGQSGSIFVVQDATGGRTLAYGSYWDWGPDGAPTLSTGANAVDRIDYIVRSTTSIHAVWSGPYS